MRKIGLLATIVVCIAIILGGVIYFMQPPTAGNKAPVSHDRATEEAEISKAQQLMSSGKVEDALAIIHNYEDQINPKTDLGRQWLDLLIESSMKTANFSQLILLYEAYPRAFDNNERAILMVADGYILAKRPQDYREIKNNWKDKATQQEMWVALDADALLLEGKKLEALSLLKGSKFEGKKDVDRLVRLALLYVVDNPKMAWDYLAEAYTIDPQNPDIITYRGKLLESLGKDSLALYEYLAAIQAAPENMFLRDQLAEFYMRRNQGALALSVWLETLSRPSLDLIWLKALFWSKVLTPVNFDWAKAVPPTGSDKAFIQYLIALPAGTYWDEAAFEKLPNSKKFLSNLQITFWLRLIQALKDNNDKEALSLLKFNAFAGQLLNPQLEKALKQIVSYRKNGVLNLGMVPINTTNEQPKKHEKNDSTTDLSKGSQSFFDLLNSYADKESEESSHQQLPQDLKDLLSSKEVFSATFLAAGWLEAALQLQKETVIPANFPEWIPYGITQALRTNRSSADALAFALKQHKTPSLSILIGELYIADKKPDEALVVLKPFLDDQTDIGYRATWLTSVIYVDKQDFAKAKEIIESRPKLAEDPLGKEALARIALLQGNTELADQLYTQLQDQSPEAMSYLARKAYADKDWKRAQTLTEQLLLMFPDSPILRDNLSRIVEEQKTETVK